MIARRTFLLGAGSAAVLAPAARASVVGAEGRIIEAMEHAGGRRWLSAVRSLEWEGRANVFDKGRTISIGVRTKVAPLSWARSESWLLSEGAKSSRTMLITPDGGWVERGGRTEPLPPGIVVHERQQFSIYGLMLLAPLLRPGVVLRSPPREHAGPERGLRKVEVIHPRAPRTTLFFDLDWRLAAAENEVSAPDGEGTIAQRFLFSKERMPGHVKWPRRLSIAQNGKTAFVLELTSFKANY